MFIEAFQLMKKDSSCSLREHLKIGIEWYIYKAYSTDKQMELRNPGRDISFPIFIRTEIETRKLERKSRQKISCLIDLLYRLSDKISR